MKTFVVLGLTLVLVLGARADDPVSSCWEQTCHECSKTALDDLSKEIRCSPRSLLTPGRVDPNRSSLPSTVQNDTGFQYVCVKMVAYNEKIDGDNTDIIRGCHLKNEVERLCQQFKDLESGKEKNSFSCDYCGKDLCNGATKISTSTVLALITISIVKALLI